MSILAGAQTYPYLDGDAGDFGPPSSATFYTPTGLALDPYGNVFVVDGTAARVRGVVQQQRVNCPAGFQCPCVALQPCVAPAFFCPGNSTPYSVSPGYRAVSRGAAAGQPHARALAEALVHSGGAAAPSATLVEFSGEEGCPAGSYCKGGVVTLCPPGSYGVAPRQVFVDSCFLCPEGTYNEQQGAVSPTACKRCPQGSSAPTAGANVCVWNKVGPQSPAPCANGSFAYAGPFGGCAAARGAVVTVDANGYSVLADWAASNGQFIKAPLTKLTYDVAIPIGAVFAIPLLVFLLIHALRLCGARCAQEDSPTHERVVERLFAFMRSFDQVRAWGSG